MRCPKCRCEVGNQPICPFCGATVYMTNATWEASNQGSRTTMPVRGYSPTFDTRSMERKMRKLEVKLNLLLVLQTGSFALTLITLLVLALT